MLVKRKIWLNHSLIATAGAGLLAMGGLAGCSGGESGAEGGEGGEAAQAQGGEGGEGGEAGAAGTGDFPGGTFESALSKVMAGEGGEGGIGLTKGDRTVSIPQLNDAQITQVVSGNTLRTEHHLAYHFDPAGTGEGFEIQWSKVDPSQCTAETLSNGECWTSKTVPLPAAKWTVSNGTLCLDPAIPAVTGAGSCVEAYMILNKVALYGSDGNLVGKGSDLYAGRKLEETVSR